MAEKPRPPFLPPNAGFDALAEDKKRESGILVSPNYEQAIVGIESGGDFNAIGPPNKKGQRAYGKYQVMDFNVGPWTKEILGTEMTPDDFLANQEAQTKVFQAKFGDLVKKHGPSDAAAIWFSGRPLEKSAKDADITGTTTAAYVGEFNKRAGIGTRKMPNIPNMLAKDDQSFSDVIQPPSLIQGEPPANESEFGSRFSEMAAFAARPEGKAALLQFAVSVLQPQPLGQTGIGHIASAVGQGAAAAGRAQKTEFEERILTEREKRGARAEDRAGRAEERQLAQSEATIKFYSDRARVMDEQVRLAEAKLERDEKKMAQKERLATASGLVSGTIKIIDELKSSLLEVSAKNEPNKYKGIQAQIEAHRQRLVKFQGIQEKMLEQNLGPGAVAEPTGPRVFTPSQEQKSTALSSPENIRATRDALKKRGYVASPEFETELQAAEKSLGLGTREIKPFSSRPDIQDRKKLAPHEAARSGIGIDLHKALVDPDTGEIVSSIEELKKLPKEKREVIQDKLVKALGEAPKPDDDSAWTDILSHPILAMAAERLWKRETEEARKRLTTPTSRQQSRRLNKEKLKGIFE